MVSIGKYRSVDRPTSRNKTRNRICPVIFAVIAATGVFYFSISRILSTTSSLRQRSSPTPIKGDLMIKCGSRGYGATEIWREIMQEGQQLMNETCASRSSNKACQPFIAVEVGANDAIQAIEMAKYGLIVHSFEPSPKSFQRMKNQVERQSIEIQERIFMYNAAAGNSKGTVEFVNSGSTGDHIGGGVNGWNMTKTSTVDTSNSEHIMHIQSIRMDSFFNNELKPDHGLSLVKDIDDNIFAAKIDTQGFEPKVFEGMKETITKLKIQYILTEFWPKGINLMNDYTEKCEEALQYLYMLHDAGYTLYAAPIMSHHKAPGYQFIKVLTNRKSRPFEDLKQDCLGMYNLEEQFPDETYHMGYWTDVIAVSPHAQLPRDPKSIFGRIIKESILGSIAK